MNAINADVNAIQGDGVNITLLDRDFGKVFDDVDNAQSEMSTLYTEATTSALQQPLGDLIGKLAQVSQDISSNNPDQLIADINTLASAAKTDEAAIGRACGTTAAG